MTSRRAFLAGSATIAALPALVRSVSAQPAPRRDNPMPDVLRNALERNPAVPVLGNPDGNVTLSEFFDYNCPFCRTMMPVVHRLMLSDPQLRVVFREVPVFGEGSQFAARASLASMEQGLYWQFHDALMRLRSPAVEASVLRIADQVGLDRDRLRADMEAQHIEDQIAQSMELAEHMGLMGTPTFIAGNEAVFGEQPLSEMQGLIARARAIMG